MFAFGSAAALLIIDCELDRDREPLAQHFTAALARRDHNLMIIRTDNATINSPALGLTGREKVKQPKQIRHKNEQARNRSIFVIVKGFEWWSTNNLSPWQLCDWVEQWEYFN